MKKSLREKVIAPISKINDFTRRRAPRAIARGIPRIVIKKGLDELYRKVNNKEFFTYHARPKKSGEIDHSSKRVPKNTFAIILQGPLKVEEDFTLETVKIYKKLDPGAEIIVSTWRGEDDAYIKKIKKAGAQVITSPLLKKRGIGNINLQLLSTQKGIKKAKDLGCSYVLKSRTDMRHYIPDMFFRLRALQKTFPLKKIERQRERIIITSFNTFKYRLYGATDTFMFGHIEDMETFWMSSFDKREERIPYTTLYEEGKAAYSEIFLTIKFLEKIGEKINYTLEDSWTKIKNHFCIVDDEFLDLYFFKYESLLEHRGRYYKNDHAFERMDFGFWLSLYSGEIKPKEAPENFLNTPLGKFVNNKKKDVLKK